MQYRTFPRIPGVKVSVLGFGAMRLPVLDGDMGRIDETALAGMLKTATDAGVNYLDTAYVYHRGQSEGTVGWALERLGLRDKFMIATKSPLWNVEAESDWDRFLDEQLGRLRTDHIDFYLFHGVNAASWGKVRRLDGIKAMEKAKADGRIRHLGFSFHDSLDTFKTVIDAYDGWEFCQVQYNYLDIDYQAGRQGIAYAAAKDIGVIVMEPLRGGGLADLPPGAQGIFAR
jgi:predicted aldo/keto reductase-like oxidoreductase